MSIKLIVTDIDDTIMAGDHLTIPKENIEAFRKAHEMGIKTAIASGRTVSLSEDVIKDIGCLDYAIVSNGSVAIDLKDNSVLYSNYINRRDSKIIIDMLEEYKAIYEVYSNRRIMITPYSYENYDTDLFASNFVQYMKDLTHIVEDMSSDEIVDTIEKFNVIYLEPEILDMVQDKLSGLGTLEIIRPYKGYMEITDVKSSKGAALQMLCRRMGILQDEVLCCGDSNNDISMLKWAGCSVAMGNADDNVKAAAKHITLTNDEAGVAKAIEKYVFS